MIWRTFIHLNGFELLLALGGRQRAESLQEVVAAGVQAVGVGCEWRKTRPFVWGVEDGGSTTGPEVGAG